MSQHEKSFCFSSNHPKSVILSEGSRFCEPQPKDLPRGLSPQNVSSLFTNTLDFPRRRHVTRQPGAYSGRSKFEAAQELSWLNGSSGCGKAGSLAGPSAAARMKPRAFAQDDRFMVDLERAIRRIRRGLLPTLSAWRAGASEGRG